MWKITPLASQQHKLSPQIMNFLSRLGRENFKAKNEREGLRERDNRNFLTKKTQPRCKTKLSPVFSLVQPFFKECHAYSTTFLSLSLSLSLSFIFIFVVFSRVFSGRQVYHYIRVDCDKTMPSRTRGQRAVKMPKSHN